MLCVNVVSFLFVSPTGTCVTGADFGAFIVIFIVATAVIVLNVMVLLGMRGGVAMSEPSNLLVANLALCDLVTGVVLLYYSLYSLLEWQHVKECELRVGIMVALNLLSGLNITLLSIDRFLKIKFPLKYLTIVTMHSAACACAVTWLLTLAVGLAPVLGWNDEQALLRTEFCAFFTILPNSYLIAVSSIFLFTLLVIVGIYPRLCRLSRRHAAAMTAQNGQMRAQSRSAVRLAKTITSIMLAYFLCWIPIVVYLLAVLAERTLLPSLDMETLITFAEAVGFTNSLVNPILYAITIPAIRSFFRHACPLCSCCKQCPEDSSVAASSFARSSFARSSFARSSFARSSFSRSVQSAQPEVSTTSRQPQVFCVMSDPELLPGYVISDVISDCPPPTSVTQIPDPQ